MRRLLVCVGAVWSCVCLGPQPEWPFAHSQMTNAGVLQHFSELNDDFMRAYREPCVIFAGLLPADACTRLTTPTSASVSTRLATPTTAAINNLPRAAQWAWAMDGMGHACVCTRLICYLLPLECPLRPSHTRTHTPFQIIATCDRAPLPSNGPLPANVTIVKLVYNLISHSAPELQLFSLQ